jgi:hypothetical protein
LIAGVVLAALQLIHPDHLFYPPDENVDAVPSGTAIPQTCGGHNDPLVVSFADAHDVAPDAVWL